MKMEYRTLGKSGTKVGVIGLGTEYLNKQPRKSVVSVVQKAVLNNVNYIDFVFNFPDYLDNFAAALKDVKREEVVLAIHIGSAEKNGQYRKTRNVKECEQAFSDTISRLHCEYADIATVHFVKTEKEYHQIVEAGVFDLAHDLKQEGRARLVSMSTHDLFAATKAVKGGLVDMIMIQVNLANNALPHRDEMLSVCAQKGVGVVAMKPFAGGKLLQHNRTVRIAQYQTGGKSMKKKIPPEITPVQCLNYALSQVGISCTVPGVKNMQELEEVLAFLDASDEEKDFSDLLTHFKEYITGECVYCNHCLPCPSSIDIGEVIRLLDMAQTQITKNIQSMYDAFSAPASQCTECNACKERCPFEVDVVARMKQAATFFEKRSKHQ